MVTAQIVKAARHWNLVQVSRGWARPQMGSRMFDIWRLSAAAPANLPLSAPPPGDPAEGWCLVTSGDCLIITPEQRTPDYKMYNHGEGPFYKGTFKTLLRHYAKGVLTHRK